MLANANLTLDSKENSPSKHSASVFFFFNQGEKKNLYKEVSMTYAEVCFILHVLTPKVK